MPFSQIIPPSPTDSKRLFYTSVSLLLSHIQGYHYHLSKFHIHAFSSVQSLSRVRLCNPMNRSTPGLPVHHHILFIHSSAGGYPHCFHACGCWKYSVQFSSVAQSCPTLCNPMNRSMPGLPVHHHLPEYTQTHVHRVRDAIQPSHPQSSPSPPAPNPSQHQSLFE